jgi:hypothetical protein
MAPSIGFVGALSYPIEGASAKMEGEGAVTPLSLLPEERRQMVFLPRRKAIAVPM